MFGQYTLNCDMNNRKLAHLFYQKKFRVLIYLLGSNKIADTIIVNKRNNEKYMQFFINLL